MRFLRCTLIFSLLFFAFNATLRAQGYARVSLIVKHKEVKLDNNFTIYFIRKDSTGSTVIKPQIRKDSFLLPDILMDDADKYYFVLKYKNKTAMLICDRYVYDCRANWKVIIEDDPMDYPFLYDKTGKLFKVDEALLLKKYSRLCLLEIDPACDNPVLYRTGINNVNNAEVFIRHLLYL